MISKAFSSLIDSRGKRAATLFVAVLAALLATNWRNYRSYFYGTIYEVQTVAFNILSHTLPTTLSLYLIQGNSEAIKSTLNSNYGLFGIVVTNCRKATRKCPDQKILYATQRVF